jgi:UDP-N-acetylmuramoyl-L-alanyl-D-glutamate--2,6-diaminopimelate ligase
MNTAEKVVYKTTLKQLLDGIAELPQDMPLEQDIKISGLKLDSRLVETGDLFLACFGKNHDARDYIDVAIKNGAVAVLAHTGARWLGYESRKGVPVIAVDNLAAITGEIAARFFDDPSAAMTTIGVTGTNGKTSCTQFIAQVVSAMGRPCGLIGTLGSGVAPQLMKSEYTTPDAISIQSALAQMRQQGAEMVAMEVSSQGLHQYRVTGVRFDVAVFTNLTRDHLDYHGSMEDYAETKRKLFMVDGLSSAIVNVDDPFANRILNTLAQTVRSYTYSMFSNRADVHALNLELHHSGYKARIHTPFGEVDISGRLLGKFNFSNLLAVLSVLLATESSRSDFSLNNLIMHLTRLYPVEGRMQIVECDSDITVVVDYAHTPDALRVALLALRDHFNRKIWCVFGCGGNRDQGKRPLMGETAERFADVLIVTDDNPRMECADEIVRQILLGIEDSSRITVQRDRAEAIAWAISNAEKGDVVLIAGKGHESYQEIKDRRVVFSDVNQARLALQKRREIRARMEG